ncbi:MAG: hypothetical protein GFGODING_01594 [Flavobacteriales bacterium]|nr:hypothetical protein [Flavobacteriales bacterium]
MTDLPDTTSACGFRHRRLPGHRRLFRRKGQGSPGPARPRTSLAGAVLLSFVLLAYVPAAAQAQGRGFTARFDRNKGVVLEHDSLFRMTLRFRMQNRFALWSERGDELSIGGTDIRVRRLRLRFEGHVLSPKVQYKVQLGFSRADMDLIEGTVAHPIRDAVAQYAPNKHWTFALGQTKLPGNRQRTVSSGAQQLPDRSIVNGAFTLDRDFGFFGTWQGKVRTHGIAVKAAVTSGEGRNASPGDEGLCYTGRMEWLPLGAFTDGGDEFEGDLARESSPKLAVAAGYAVNVHARRAGGQLGHTLPDGQRRTLNTFIADAVLKYRGLAISTEFLQRDVEGDPLVLAADSSVVPVLQGWGWNTQVSHMLGARNEVVARYSLVTPVGRVASVLPQREEGWLGWSHYVNHHRVKVQAAMSYAWSDGMAATDAAGTRWGLWFQVELGI